MLAPSLVLSHCALTAITGGLLPAGRSIFVKSVIVQNFVGCNKYVCSVGIIIILMVGSIGNKRHRRTAGTA